IRGATVLPQDGTGRPGSGVTIPDNLVRGVDAVREGFRASQTGENLERTLGPKERPDHPDPGIGPDAMPGNVACIIDRRGPADDVPRRGAEVADWIRWRWRRDCPESRVGDPGRVFAPADRLPCPVNGSSLAGRATQRAEV